MEIKTHELEGAALDWAVANAMGMDCQVVGNSFDTSWLEDRLDGSRSRIFGRYRPSTDWSQGGPLIDAHSISFATIGTGRRDENGKEPVVSIISGVDGGIGQASTHLVAACRAIVFAKLGDCVEIPDELGAA